MRLRLVLIGALVLAAVGAVVAVVVRMHSSSSPSSSPTTPTSSHTTPTSSATPPPRSLASSASASPHAVVQAYWKDIATGHFRAAFLKFDRSEQKRSHGQQWFINDKARDAPIRVRLQLGPTAVNRPFATVPIVLLQTIGSSTGCHHWTGSYRLRDINSRWLIDAANLTKHSC
ncbi:MAG: hypothetical protein ACXVRK_00015 [Gaiellaceae bacterium]